MPADGPRWTGTMCPGDRGRQAGICGGGL